MGKITGKITHNNLSLDWGKFGCEHLAEERHLERELSPTYRGIIKCISRMKEVIWHHNTCLGSLSVQLSHIQPVRQLHACSPHLGGDGPGREVGMDLPPQVPWPNAAAPLQGQVLRDVCVAEYTSHPETASHCSPLSWRDGNQHGPWGTSFVGPGCSTLG